MVVEKHQTRTRVKTWVLDLPVVTVVKNPISNVGDMSLTPGFVRSRGIEMATHSNILAWEIP